MLPEQIKNFREMVTLKDGAYVLLRPMNSTDEKHLLEFYSAVSDEDMRSFRHYAKDPELIHTWCAQLDYSKVMPLLAFVKDHVVGSASLHFFEGPKRHVGEVRMFLAKAGFARLSCILPGPIRIAFPLIDFLCFQSLW